MTLVEVIIVAGIIGVLALAATQLMSDQQKAMRHTEAMFASVTLDNNIRQTFASVVDCSRNLGPLSGAAKDPNVVSALTTISRDNAGVPVVMFGLSPATYENGTLEIVSINFGKAASYAGPNPSPVAFPVPLEITMRKTKDSYGSVFLPLKTITIWVTTDAAGLVQTCSSDRLGAFSSELLAANGFVRYPNGLMMQWGQAMIPANTPAGYSIPFTVPFTSQVYSVILNGTSDGSNNAKDNWPAVMRHPIQTTLTSFGVANANDSADAVSWFAIGI